MIQQLDPNWFSSSLAQCAAAIVGLLGGILATRLQQQLASARITNAALRQSIAQARQQARQSQDWLPEYTHFASQRAQQAAKALAEGNTSMPLRGEVYVGGGSNRAVTRDVHIDAQTVGRMQNAAALAGTLEAAAERVMQSATVESTQSYCKALKALMAEAPNDTQRPGLLAEVLTAFDSALVAHNANTSIASPVALSAILAWLCVAGILVPVGQLSAYSVASKQALMIAVGSGVLAIPAFVVTQTIAIARLSSRSVVVPMS